MKRFLLTGLLAVSTSAATVPAATGAAAVTERHCVAVLAPAATAAKATPDVVCYSTFAAASRAGGAPNVATSTPLLGIEYTGSGYTGSTLSLYGSSGTGCSGGVTYGFSSLGGGWNDTISSAKSYSNCVGRHYDNSGYGGIYVDCWCSSMGSVDNRTSSILFY